MSNDLGIETENNVSIMFVSAKGFVPVAWLIRFFQAQKGQFMAPFSHVVVKVYSRSLNRNLYYDATGQGLSFKNDIEIFSHYDIFKSFSIPCADSHVDRVLQWCIDNLHIQYGYSQVAWLALSLILKKAHFRLPIWVKNGRKRMICNEVGLYLLTDVMGKEIAVNPDSTDINWLYEYLSNLDSK